MSSCWSTGLYVRNIAWRGTPLLFLALPCGSRLFPAPFTASPQVSVSTRVPVCQQECCCIRVRKCFAGPSLTDDKISGLAGKCNHGHARQLAQVLAATRRVVCGGGPPGHHHLTEARVSVEPRREPRDHPESTAVNGSVAEVKRALDAQALCRQVPVPMQIRVTAPAGVCVRNWRLEVDAVNRHPELLRSPELRESGVNSGQLADVPLRLRLPQPKHVDLEVCLGAPVAHSVVGWFERIPDTCARQELPVSGDCEMSGKQTGTFEAGEYRSDSRRLAVSGARSIGRAHRAARGARFRHAPHPAARAVPLSSVPRTRPPPTARAGQA